MRTLVGLAVRSGWESADAAVVQIEGSGLELLPRVIATAQVPFPADARERWQRFSRQIDPFPTDLTSLLIQSLTMAARQATHRVGIELRSVLAMGLITPWSGFANSTDPSEQQLAEGLAEATGSTVAAGFAGRDRAAGGSGRMIGSAADALLLRDPLTQRVLIHLGSVTSVLAIPPRARLSSVIGFEAGPGNRLLDELCSLGTRGRDPYDSGGTRAVQGRCLDPLLSRWMAHPSQSRSVPRTFTRYEFGTQFLQDAFEQTRALGGTLHDLLCTATHYVVRCLSRNCGRFLPGDSAPRQIYVSGGGSRNGFLWKLLAAEFPGERLERYDQLGIPGTHRPAVSAAILTALLLDGVPASLPLVTGAGGARLIGRLTPGDQLNWAACTNWMAEQGPRFMPRAA